MNYTIKPITQDDVPFLWEMLYESLFVPEGSKPFAKEILKDPLISMYVEDWGREGDFGFIAYNHEDQPIGSITIRFFDENNKGFAYISNEVPELGMALLKEYRGRGIGTALLNQVFVEAFQKNIKRIALSVDPRNIAALKLYRRFGFIEVGKVGTSITMVADVQPIVFENKR